MRCEYSRAQARQHNTAILFKMERAKGSAIWRFFTLSQPTSPTATCNTCGVNVPRGGVKSSSCNTTNLIKHLQKFHIKEHAEFIELNKQKGSGMKQLTLMEMKERSEHFPTNIVQAKKNHRGDTELHCYGWATAVGCRGQGIPAAN